MVHNMKTSLLPFYFHRISTLKVETFLDLATFCINMEAIVMRAVWKTVFRTRENCSAERIRAPGLKENPILPVRNDIKGTKVFRITICRSVHHSGNPSSLPCGER